MSQENSGPNISRRDLIKVGAQGAAFVAAGTALAACGSSGSTSKASTAAGPALSPGPSSAGTPVHGGTLTVALTSDGAAETIDVRKITYEPDIARGGALFDCIFTQAPGGLAPALGLSAESNSDGTVWTFKLRDGVTFHNGKPFGADDVIYTIKASWDAPQSYFKGVASTLIDVKNIKKLDNLTVQIPLLRPFAQFPTISAWQNGGVVPDGFTDWNKPIGTGPFKYESFTPGSSSTFSANRDYWDSGPYVDELVIDSSYTDDAARVNAVIGNQAQIAPSAPPTLVRANAGSTNLVIGNASGPQFASIVCRVDVAPFSDPRVMRALKLLTNRPAIVSDAWDGYATDGNDCPAPTLQYWDASYRAPYDPEQAKSLLKAAGAQDLNMPVVTASYLPGLVEGVTLWSAQATAAGLKLPVKQIPTSQLFDTSAGYASKSRPLGSTYWNTVPWSLGAFYLNALTPKGEYPETGWGQGPGQSITLIEDALSELNPAQAEMKWYEVQQQQIQHGGYVIFANPTFLDVYAPNVRGMQTNGAGNCGNFTFHHAWLAS